MLTPSKKPYFSLKSNLNVKFFKSYLNDTMYDNVDEFFIFSMKPISHGEAEKFQDANLHHIFNIVNWYN